jgi:hypothetical protein
MIFPNSVKKFFSKTSKQSYISPQIIEVKNLEDFEDLSSDFSGLRNLDGLCNLTGLNSLYSPISSKNFLILIV